VSLNEPRLTAINASGQTQAEGSEKSESFYRVVIAPVRVYCTYRFAVLTALRADDRVCLLVAGKYNVAVKQTLRAKLASAAVVAPKSGRIENFGFCKD